MELSKSKLSKYSLLRHKKYRERDRLFLMQGEKAVKDTYRNFPVEAIIVNKDSDFHLDVDPSLIYNASAADLKKITTLENCPDIIAVYRIPEKKQDLFFDKSKGFTLVLDGIQDPGNLGTIIRTAHWFGIKKIYCSTETVDIYNPKAAMATMGSLGKVDITYCNLEELFQTNQGIPVYGLLLEGENIFMQQDLAPGFILMGSEGHGPKTDTLRYITNPLTIPAADPNNSPDSLNVAIATAITLSQMIK